LDAPLVTFREPDVAADEADVDEAVGLHVADAMYRYLDRDFGAQAIVIENPTPPELSTSAITYRFSPRALARQSAPR
jgi:hypothetical protein